MKKFKLNWGTGITIVIISFLVITIGQVVFIHKTIDYDLVEEEYYEAEIQFQTQIEKVKRTNALPEKLNVKLIDDFVEFNFPTMFESNSVGGIINFYKPSDDLLDKAEDIKLDSDNKMFFGYDQLSPGLWKIKINWSVNDLQYYNEKIVMLP